MCDPVTLTAVSIGLTVASTAASAVGQAQAASAQTKQNRLQAAAEQEAAVANYDQLEQRRSQEQAAASQQVFENSKEALVAAERSKTAAGEAGVSGLSVDALLRDVYGREAGFNDSVAQNFENTNFEIDTQKENVQRGAASAINSLPPVQRPNYLGLGLQAASGIAGHYGSYLKMKAPSTSGSAAP